MGMTVQGDHVAGRGDLRGERGAARDLLAHEEEGREGTGRREVLEHGEGPLEVGAVVEGERNAAFALDRPTDAERPPGVSTHRPDGGRGVKRGGSGRRAGERPRYQNHPR